MTNEVTRHCFGVILLFGAFLIWAIAQWQRYADAPRPKRIWREVLCLLASLYPLGKGCQVLLLGPRWWRFYIGDAGFIPAFAVSVTFFGYLVAFGLGAAKPPFQPWRLRRLGRRLAYLGWLIAVSVEMLTLAIQPAKPTIPFSARGDLVDLAIFCLMLPVTLVLIQLATDPTRSVTPPPSAATRRIPRLPRGGPSKRHRRS